MEPPLQLIHRPGTRRSEWIFARPALSPEEELRISIAVEQIYSAHDLQAASDGLDEQELAFISRPEHGGRTAHVYGATGLGLMLPLFSLLRDGEPLSSADTFADLGSGNGKLTLLMQLLAAPSRSIGVELSTTRHAQAVNALYKARCSGLLPRQASDGPQFICASMLDVNLHDATLIFVYDLCLDEEFLHRLERHMVSELPLGASILIRGKKLPEASSSIGMNGKRLELRLRVTMFYGYVVVDDGSARPPAVLRPHLRQTTEQLGTSGYERALFVDALPGHVPTAAEMALW